MSLCISSRSFNIICFREVTGVFLHEGNAHFAADTAALSSPMVVKESTDTTLWVAYLAIITSEKDDVIKRATDQINK